MDVDLRHQHALAAGIRSVDVSTGDVQRRRAQLLIFVFIVVAGMALSMLLLTSSGSEISPDDIRRTPAVRFSPVILVLMLGAYVAEKELHLRHLLDLLITDRALMDNMAREIRHDPVTGLPNRRAFIERLEEAISRSERASTGLAVLFVDLDGFKAVNDAHGHESGDRLLVLAAERLKRAVRGSDTVARFGGDEFVVLVQPIDSVDEATFVAERIIDLLGEPVPIGDTTAHVGGSVGIATTWGGGSPSRLIRQADVAMYHAKRGGGGRWDVLDEDSPEILPVG